MNTVLIDQCYERSFFNYISDNHQEVYKTINSFCVRRIEEKNLFFPYDTKFFIDYQETIVEVEIKREHTEPKFDGNGLNFLLAIKIKHDNLDLLKKLATEIGEKRNESNGTIQIYHSNHHGYWSKSNKVYGQTIENIFIPGEAKKEIIDHIDSFLKNQERYVKFGRTYKLCFLFTGVPGSGKSSTIKAIAMKYNRPIYVLNLSKKLDDENLNNLVSEMKPGCIIVLEDIDSFFMDREAKGVNVSFSAILNMFDGLYSPGNGSLLFMTANNPEYLDSALIRPGRVDKIIKFDYPRKNEINHAFNAIIGDAQESFNSFYKTINGSNISMAGIVDYLFRHPQDYLDAVSELNEHTKLLHEITEKNSQHLYK
jgi:hypothetical protein